MLSLFTPIVLLPLSPQPQQAISAQDHHHIRECKSIIRLSQQVQAKIVASSVATEIANQTLTDYTHARGLEESLKNVTKKILCTDSKSLKIIEADEIGYSGDKVYCVWDSDANQPLAIIKVFQESSKNFFPEVFALNYLQSNHIPSFFSPQIKGFGKCLLQKKNCFFIVESIAPGCSLRRHYRESLPFADLERGIRECGRALAKLHQYAPGTPQSLPDYLEEGIRQDLDKAVEQLKTFPQERIDPEKLQKLFEKTLTDLKSEAFPTGVIHGDAKLINVFFEPRTDTVTWIDSSRLSASIDLLDGSIGNPAKDFYTFIADIEHQQIMYFLENDQICSKKLMSDEEIRKLVEAFTTGYQEGGAQTPTQKQLAFFSLAAHLYFIGRDSTKDVNRYIPEPLKNSKKYRMNKIFKDLETRL